MDVRGVDLCQYADDHTCLDHGGISWFVTGCCWLLSGAGWQRGRCLHDGRLAGRLCGPVAAARTPHLTVHDPEGILSTVPAVATALLGMFTGEFIKMQREGLTDKKKVGGLVISGAVLLAVGLLWSLFFPINKNLVDKFIRLCCRSILRVDVCAVFLCCRCVGVS